MRIVSLGHNRQCAVRNKHNIVASSDGVNGMDCTEEQPFVSNVEDLECNFIQDDVDKVNQHYHYR